MALSNKLSKGGSSSFSGVTPLSERLRSSRSGQDTFTYAKGTKEQEERLREYLQIGKEAGLKPPKQEPKPGTVSKLVGLLSATETASLTDALLSGDKEALRKYGKQIGKRATLGGFQKEDVTYEDVLRKAGFGKGPSVKTPVGEISTRGAAGVGLDILLDPMTYAGIGGLTELGEQGAKVAAKEAGEEFLTKSGKEVAEKLTKEGVEKLAPTAATQAAKGQRALLSAKLPFGLSGGGKTIVKGTPVFEGLEAAARKVGKTPGIGDVAEWGRKAFAEKATPLARRGIPELEEEWSKLIKAQETAETIKKVGRSLGHERGSDIARRIREISKATGEDSTTLQRKILERIEGTPIGHSVDLSGLPKESYELVGDLHNMQLDWYKRAADVGINQLSSDDVSYWIHTLSQEELDKLGKKVGVGRAKKYTTKSLLDKARNLKKLVNDAGNTKIANVKDFEEIGKGLVKDSDEVVWEVKDATIGEINELIGRKFFSTDIPLTSFITESRLSKKEAGAAFMRQVQELGEPADIAPEVWRQPAGSIKELKGLKFHPEVVEHVEDTYKALTNEETVKQFLKVYDKVQNFWKRSVTSIFPAFHTRNALSNIWQNFLGGITDVDAYKKATSIQKKRVLGQSLSEAEKELWEAFNKKGLAGWGFYGGDIPKKFGKLVKEEEASLQKRLLRKIAKSPRKGSEYIEDHAKLAHFIDKVKRGNTVEQAARSVKKYLFDYEDLTSFEKGVMKRIFPFYTWTRKNIPLQVESLITDPGTTSSLLKAMRGGGLALTPEETENLPEYMRDWALAAGEKKGKESWIYGIDVPPADLTKFFRGDIPRTGEAVFGQMASPLIKGVIEPITGRHTYFGKPLEETNWVDEPMAKAISDIGLGDVYGIVTEEGPQGDTYYRTTKPALHNFLMNFMSRSVSTAGKITDEDMKAAAKAAYLLFGAKARAISPEQQEYYRSKEKAEELGKWLEERGALESFQRYYQPKE